MNVPQLVLLTSALLLIALLIWQWRERRRMEEIIALARAGGPYHSVAIRSRGGQCVAVRELSGRRLLSNEAPSLPVAGCTNANCRCSYVHFDDRRGEDRREAYRGRHIPEHLRSERRVRRDRRGDPSLRSMEAA